MHVRCSHCHAGYTLPAEKLSPGRRVQFACRHCGQRIVVQVPGEEPVAAPSPAPADEPRMHHHPRFDIDESVLSTAAAALARAGAALLEEYR